MCVKTVADKIICYTFISMNLRVIRTVYFLGECRVCHWFKNFEGIWKQILLRFVLNCFYQIQGITMLIVASNVTHIPPLDVYVTILCVLKL